MSKATPRAKPKTTLRNATTKAKRLAEVLTHPRTSGGRNKGGELRRDEAVAIIREQILVGSPGFRSGDILTETQLTADLDLTLSPVRQALAQLATEGLVSVLPRVGTQVRIVRPEEAQAIMAMRFAIETVIVCDLARSQPDLTDLETILKKMEQLASGKDSHSSHTKYNYAKLDMDFHAKMAESARGYATAAHTLRQLTSQFFLYAYQAIPASNARKTMDEVNREHREILDAIQKCKGKPFEPTQKIQEHIQRSVDRLAPFASDYLRSVKEHLSSSN